MRFQFNIGEQVVLTEDWWSYFKRGTVGVVVSRHIDNTTSVEFYTGRAGINVARVNNSVLISGSSLPERECDSSLLISLYV